MTKSLLNLYTKYLSVFPPETISRFPKELRRKAGGETSFLLSHTHGITKATYHLTFLFKAVESRNI